MWTNKESYLQTPLKSYHWLKFCVLFFARDILRQREVRAVFEVRPKEFSIYLLLSYRSIKLCLYLGEHLILLLFQYQTSPLSRLRFTSFYFYAVRFLLVITEHKNLHNGLGISVFNAKHMNISQLRCFGRTLKAVNISRLFALRWKRK